MDNSEWMRNGDYTPTRLEAQKDCVNLLFGSKIQANPENTVGLLTMAGKGYIYTYKHLSDLVIAVKFNKIFLHTYIYLVQKFL